MFFRFIFFFLWYHVLDSLTKLFVFLLFQFEFSIFWHNNFCDIFRSFTFKVIVKTKHPWTARLLRSGNFRKLFLFFFCFSFFFREQFIYFINNLDSAERMKLFNHFFNFILTQWFYIFFPMLFIWTLILNFQNSHVISRTNEK